MANPVEPNTYKTICLDNEVSNSLTGAILKLFTNAATVDDAMVVGDFTIASWGGYANQALVGWSAAALDGSNHAFTTADPVQFANTSGSAETAYGYLYVDAGGNLISAALYDVPISIPDGLFLQETITHTRTSEF